MNLWGYTETLPNKEEGTVWLYDQSNQWDQQVSTVRMLNTGGKIIIRKFKEVLPM